MRREVLEEGDEEARSLNIEVTGNANFHMQVNSFYIIIKLLYFEGNIL